MRMKGFFKFLIGLALVLSSYHCAYAGIVAGCAPQIFCGTNEFAGCTPLDHKNWNRRPPLDPIQVNKTYHRTRATLHVDKQNNLAATLQCHYLFTGVDEKGYEKHYGIGIGSGWMYSGDKVEEQGWKLEREDGKMMFYACGNEKTCNLKEK